MASDSSATKKGFRVQFEDGPVAQFVFGDVRLSWLWLIVRLYAGYQWLMAGYEKVINPQWNGAALGGFLKGALSKTTGTHPDVQGWYAAFLQNVAVPHANAFAKVVAYGELLVGIALILGIFTGIAAFFGSFMNMNYLLAGTVSTNPGLFLLCLVLVLAWKTAGWLGLDHWILPLLGTPWAPGKVIKQAK